MPLPCSIASELSLQILRNAGPPQAVHSCPARVCNSSLRCSACRAQRQYVLDLVQMAQNALLHGLPAIEQLEM